MDTKSFERGGVLPKNKTKLFKTSNYGASNIEKEKFKQKPSKRGSKKGENDIKNDGEYEIRSAKQLTLNTLVPEMNLMAVVKAIHHTYLLLSLPGRLVGRVPITNISNSYSNAIKSTLEDVHSEEDLSEKPKNLADMFKIGQILYTKVIDKCHGEKQEILLSLLPSDINSEIDATILKEGNVLLCAIQEIEDHGYFLETGINNVRCFLSKKNLKNELFIGELVFCKVHKVTESVINFIAFKKNDPIKIDTIDVPNMKTLLPGTLVTFNIVQNLKNGLEGLLFDGSITAYANEMYIPNKIATDSNLIGKKMNARILYTMPLSNQLYVTLHTDDYSKEHKNIIHYGTIVENAKVIKQTNLGVIFKLGTGNDKGLLPRKTIAKNFKNNFDIDSVMLKFSPNSIHTIRVMDYNVLENCYLCTNNEKLLTEKFFGTYDMIIGQIVIARIEEKLENGLRLSIGNVRAFLKGIFYHQITKCEIGTELRVRVAEIDHDAKVIQVTNLSGFLRDGCKILHSKNKLKINESFSGVVFKENPKSYNVLFFNHIKGILPKSTELESELLSIGGLKEGSVKLFEIKNIKGNSIILSIPKKVESQHIGKIFQCKVTAILPGNGLKIYINELKSYGRVPLNMLSESIPLNEHILSVITENSNMEVVAIGNNEYSRRDVHYYRRENIVTDFNEVKPSDILRCFVKSTDISNVELECPLKNFKETIRLNKNAFDDPDNVILSEGEIVYVNIIAKHESRINSLYATPSLHKVWVNNDDALDMLDNYLSDISFLLSSFKTTNKAIGKYSIGQRIDGIVKNIIGNNILIEVDENLYAQGTVDNVHNYKVGAKINEAAIVWIDPIHQMLYLTTKNKCIDGISIDQESKDDSVNEKKHKAVILYFNDFVTVCSIRGSKVSSLVYVPSKQHYNDFSPSNRALGNATSKLVIKRNCNGKLLGIFVQDSKAFQKLEKIKTKLNEKVLKRKISDSVPEADNLENKRPKVVLDDSESDEEVERQNNDNDNDSRKNALNKKEKAKKVVGSIQNMIKKSIKVAKNGNKIINKDSLLDENVVNLTSYKKLNENKLSTNSIQKHDGVIKKSTIGKKKAPKRLIKKK
ncbi:hypothetical protein PVAND_011604 [Polypedilum vanderplanki]|uniref:S1 motif domain-containing protein n=1 Tax=Polypedilum vanderplanki TaxID=319348 RepID=A0A9J6CK47_POLVA|nr:hypothetical protein PVAND_011604 [Polypedilum vanderplanki]